MDYLTNYYKNLCEQLQEKLNLLEAGYQKALRSKNPEQMKKEAYRQAYRARRKNIGQNPGQEEPDLDEKGKYARFGQLEKNMEELALRAHYAQGGSPSFWSTIPAVNKFRYGAIDAMKATRGRPGDQSKPAYRRKSKMADKDYDKDGKIETSTQEYLGSRDRAIKQAIKER
jgi:hypothetical protein